MRGWSGWQGGAAGPVRLGVEVWRPGIGGHGRIGAVRSNAVEVIHVFWLVEFVVE